MNNVNDHCPSGLKVILTAPKITMQAIIYVVGAILGSVLIWSFFGTADVVITANGVVSPYDEPKRVYSPVDGELVHIDFLEGQPVIKGMDLALVKSPEAITLAGKAQIAKTHLDMIKRENTLLPAEKEILGQQLELLRQKLAYQKSAIGDAEEQLKTFDEAWKLKMEIIKDEIKRANDEISRAKVIFDRYDKMFKQGAIAKNAFEGKENDLKLAKANSKTVILQATSAKTKALDERRNKALELDVKKGNLLETRMEIKKLEHKIAGIDEIAEQRLRLAQVQVDATSQVTLSDLDTSNLLRIQAPVDGVITKIEYTQPGDKVLATKPMFTISPRGKRCLLIQISDKDRAFVSPKDEVKIKVNAFPYMRFGLLRGTVDYIAPTATNDTKGNGTFYEAKVLFDDTDGEVNDFFMHGQTKHRVKFGMTVKAEIVVEKRRMISFILDPFRKKKD